MHLDSIPITRLSYYGWLLSTVLVASACVTDEPKPAPGSGSSGTAPSEGRTLGDQQSDRIKDLEQRNAEIQLQMFERDAQVAGLQAKLNEAIQEVVRTKAKLHSVESKAEAASTMAEAEIALKQVRAATPEPDARPELVQAEQLLQMSATEFEDQNYGGSLYLATQAKSLVRATKSRLSGTDGISRPGEAPFSVPLPMITNKKSNVRKGPGTSYDVAFTLETETPLTGLAHKGQWVRVEVDDGRTGWIYHALVAARLK